MVGNKLKKIKYLEGKGLSNEESCWLIAINKGEKENEEWN
jgi:hypothetical protein